MSDSKESLAHAPKPTRPRAHGHDAPTSLAALGLTRQGSAAAIVLQLQRFAGNQSVTALLAGVKSEVSIQRAGLLGQMIKDQRKKQAMVAALRATAQGQHALDVQDANGIGLDWVETGAASFDGSTRVLLNSKLDARVLAGYFIHEMHHVEQLKTGASPDADVSSEEQEYVDRMVNEEINGTVLGFEARLGTGGPQMPNEDRYRSTYAYWKKKTLDDGGDDVAADAKGKEMGRAMVKYLIRPGDGTWPQLAPSRLESYEMYYRRVWKKAHPAPSP